MVCQVGFQAYSVALSNDCFNYNSFWYISLISVQIRGFSEGSSFAIFELRPCPLFHPVPYFEGPNFECAL